MELYTRIEQVLMRLRPAFSREVPYEWFVLLLWGVLLNHQPAGSGHQLLERFGDSRSVLGTSAALVHFTSIQY